MAASTAMPPAPLRSPMFDARGLMTLEWQRYFQSVFHVSAAQNTQTQIISNTLTALEVGSPFDDRSPRDFGPAIEDALTLARESTRSYDDSELRALWAVSDPAPFTNGAPGAGAANSTHDEPLTDGNSNIIFAKGDVVVVIGVPN